MIETDSLFRQLPGLHKALCLSWTELRHGLRVWAEYAGGCAEDGQPNLALASPVERDAILRHIDALRAIHAVADDLPNDDMPQWLDDPIHAPDDENAIERIEGLAQHACDEMADTNARLATLEKAMSELLAQLKGDEP